MSDSYPRRQAPRRQVTARLDRIPMPPDNAAAMPAAEAQLLGVIERVLEQQRVSCDVAAGTPFVSRIETILGKRIEAANDVEVAANPSLSIAPPEVAYPAEAAANLNHAASAFSEHMSKKGRLKPLAVLGLMCALGAASSTFVPAEPARYSGEGVLVIHGNGETRAATIKATEEALSSAHAMATTVAALKLDRDPEFSGSSSDAFEVAVDLLSTDGVATDPVSRAEASLATAIRTVSDPNAGTIGFTVMTDSAAKSARIAGYLASVATGSEAATATVEGGALKKANDAAQLELASFTQKSGEGNVKVAADLQQQIGSVDAELKAAEQRIVAAQAKTGRLRSAKVGDVVDGTLDADLMSPTLVDHRDKYVVAHLSLLQLSASLGPRHPRLQGQQAEVDGLRVAIADDLSRLLRETGDEMNAITAEKRQLDGRRNALIAQSKDTGVDLPKLTELRDKANAARSRLEDAITTATVPSGAGGVRLAKPVQIAMVSAGHTWHQPLFGALAGLAFGLRWFLPRRAPCSARPEGRSPRLALRQRNRLRPRHRLPIQRLRHRTWISSVRNSPPCAPG